MGRGIATALRNGRRHRRWGVGVALVAACVVAGIVVTSSAKGSRVEARPVAVARVAVPPDLAGSWSNPQDPASPPWVLTTADSLQTLTGSWTGGAGHSGLHGSFTAALTGADVYSGTLRITEGSLDVGGTITVTIVTADKLQVSIKQTNQSNTQAFELDRAAPTGGGTLPLPTGFCTTAAPRIADATAHAAVCAPTTTLTPQDKQNAKDDLRAEIVAAAFFCRAASTGSGGGNLLVLGVAFDFVQALTLCQATVNLMAATLVLVRDPPSAGYQRVVLPGSPVQLGAPGGSCPTRVTAAACAAVRAAAAKYATAAANAVVLGAVAAKTTNRFAGALRAKSVSGAFLQAAVGKVYAGELAQALAAQQSVGRALALALRSAGLDAPVSATAVKKALAQSRSKIFSSALLDKLVAEGVAATPALARQQIMAQLNSLAGTLDPAAALSAPLPASAFTAQYRTITLSELAAIVKALSAQHAISRATGTTLHNDLVKVHAACGKATQFSAAMRGFIAAATGASPAAGLLRFAAQPLTASSVAAAACM